MCNYNNQKEFGHNSFSQISTTISFYEDQPAQQQIRIFYQTQSGELDIFPKLTTFN